MIRLFGAMLLTVLLAACGSTVKLDKVPIEDKTGTVVVPVDTRGADSSALSVRSVSAGDVAQSAQGAAMQASSRIVYFDYDSAVIRPEFQAVLVAHAHFLSSEPARKVFLEGHTDDRGGSEYNLALGQQRAEAVRHALQLLGVGENQMEAISFGKEKPADPGSDEAARAKNRRVEIRYP